MAPKTLSQGSLLQKLQKLRYLGLRSRGEAIFLV